jgi:hypothetical protein
VGLALPRSPDIHKNERSKVFAPTAPVIQEGCCGKPDDNVERLLLPWVFRPA